MSTTEVTLEYPIKRGENRIEKITLHKPKSGALRGVSLRDVLDMKPEAIFTITPRISDPKLTSAEMETEVDPADLLQIGAALANFLLPPSALAAANASLSQSE